jgi:hypothetical protein
MCKSLQENNSDSEMFIPRLTRASYTVIGSVVYPDTNSKFGYTGDPGQQNGYRKVNKAIHAWKSWIFTLEGSRLFLHTHTGPRNNNMA